MLALERIVQAQAKCLRILLLVGDDEPQAVYHFDLVGAYPRSSAEPEERFYTDIVLRIATAMSAGAVTDHRVMPKPISRDEWARLETPKAMAKTAVELGRRGFFTTMVRIADLAAVPAISDAIASQYSEGCYATHDVQLGALVSTVTGSARPIDKDRISEKDLAVIVGVRENQRGALVRHVEGIDNQPPSSEAVELKELDVHLPEIDLKHSNGTKRVPVVRSKLHGHRGIASYVPDYVEYAPMDPPYQVYPVSCSTEAQARGIIDALSRAQCLRNPDDPRQVAFTVLPGHGIVIVEKWSPDKAPFQLIWEYMDRELLVIDSMIPQGPITYDPESGGRMVLREFQLDPLLAQHGCTLPHRLAT